MFGVLAASFATMFVSVGLTYAVVLTGASFVFGFGIPLIEMGWKRIEEWRFKRAWRIANGRK